MQIGDKIEGSLWGISLTIDNLVLVASHRDLHLKSGIEKIEALRAKVALAWVKFASSLSYSLIWAQNVKWIDVGRFLPILGPIGLATRTIIYSVECKDLFPKIPTEANPQERNKLKLDFLTKVLTVAYYALALLALAVPAAGIVTAVQLFSTLSLISLLIQFSYYASLEVQKRLQTAPT